MAFVKESAKAPPTSAWKQGSLVKGNHQIREGTAIATFLNGGYPNAPTGNHAAIYLSQDSNGIWVMDQWVRQGYVAKRLIRFKGGSGSASNDGDRFYGFE